jgi:Tfp pilus assembly protein PilV
MRADRWRARRARAGIALLDVVVALAVLGLSGTGLITLLGQTAHSVRHVRQTEREVRQASDEMGRFVAYDRPILAAMVGRSLRHGWIVSVTPAGSDLFEVAIADTANRATLLTTTMYRPDTSRATTP